MSGVWWTSLVLQSHHRNVSTSAIGWDTHLGLVEEANPEGLKAEFGKKLKKALTSDAHGLAARNTIRHGFSLVHITWYCLYGIECRSARSVQLYLTLDTCHIPSHRGSSMTCFQPLCFKCSCPNTLPHWFHGQIKHSQRIYTGLGPRHCRYGFV